MKLIKGNIFNSECQTIVNTINCVGVMGAGIALEYKLRYPEMFDQYVEFCDKKQIEVGKLWIYKSSDKWVLNFPTKKHWKFPSKIEYLHAGLEKFVRTYQQREIKSVAFPLLGADKGGLDRISVLEIMTSYLDGLDCKVEVYEYDPLCSDKLFLEFKKQILSIQNVKDISLISKVRVGLIEKVIEGINENKYFTISQLQKIEGLGEKSIVRLHEYSRQLSSLGNQTDLF